MTLVRAKSKGQPVPDLAIHSTQAEYRHDREQARADRFTDYHDRDLCAAVETLASVGREPGVIPGKQADNRLGVSPSAQATAALPGSRRTLPHNPTGAE